MAITKEKLEKWFSNVPPERTSTPEYQNIRNAAHDFSKVILENSPATADQTTAIRYARLAMMWAQESCVRQD